MRCCHRRRVQALERDRVSPGGDGERGGGVALVRRARGGEGAHRDPVDQDLEVLHARPGVAALGGVEGQYVGARGPAADGLAERAGPLEEGDLHALRRRRVARGEAAVVARDAGAAGEGPGRAGRAVLELAVPHLHLLEARVARGHGGRGRRGRGRCGCRGRVPIVRVPIPAVYQGDFGPPAPSPVPPVPVDLDGAVGRRLQRAHHVAPVRGHHVAAIPDVARRRRAYSLVNVSAVPLPGCTTCVGFFS